MKLWDVITHSCSVFYVSLVTPLLKLWHKWTINYIPYKLTGVITYPRPTLNKSVLVKWSRRMSDPFVISGLGTSGITKHADESPGAAMFCRAEWRERDGNVLTQLTFSSSLPQSFSVVLRISELYLTISALRLPSDSGNDHIQRPCQQHI